MMKAIKIAAVALVIFALVANLHTALFTFYGMKTSNLAGAVWANSLSTTDDTGGTTGGGSTGDETSSDGAWYNQPVRRTIRCGEKKYSVTTSNHGAVSVSYITNPQNGQVSINVSYGAVTSGEVTGTIPAHDATMIECVGPIAMVICINRTAQEACE